VTADGERLRGLDRGVIGGWGSLALAIGSLAPAVTMGLGPLGVWYVSGAATWLVFVVTTVCMLGVAACVSVFARHVVGTGSVYTYLGQVFGRRGRVVAAACLVGGWGSLLLISVPMLVMYDTPFLGALFGPAARSDLVQALVTAFVLLFGCLLAVRGLSTSASVMWILVGLSTVVSAALLVAAAIRADGSILASFTWSEVAPKDVAKGLPLGFALLLGFEGSAAFAYETREPRTWVPRILYGVPLVFGVLLLVGTAAEVPVLAARESEVRAGASLLDVLGRAADLPWLSTVASGVLFLALVGGNLGIISMAARIFATLAQDGLLPKGLGHVHRTYRTPVVAIVLLSAVRWGAPWVIILITGRSPLDVYVWAGTLLSFWWVPLYGLTCVGAVVFTKRREGRLGHLTALAAVAGCGISGLSLGGALVWPAAGAMRALPYLFFMAFGVLLAAMSVLGRRAPDPARSHDA
jgi:amino acid transporter